MSGTRNARPRRIAGFTSGRWMKWIVLAFWVLLVMLLGPLAGKLGGVENNDATAWLPGGAESTQVVKLQQRFHSDDLVPAVMIYERPGGITAADRAKAAADLGRIAALKGAGQPQGPFVSKDGRALQSVVSIRSDDASKAVKTAREIIKRGPPGLTAHVTGPAGAGADLEAAFGGVDGLLLLAAGIVVIVLLLLIYRSPILWLIPVLAAAGALGISQAVVYLLAKHTGLTVNGQSAGILTVLVFGVATDYALLLIARYREELRRHENRHVAMAHAMHRAGPAIVASAATVTIGLLCLMAATMNSTAGLGPVAAVGVVTALIAMTTLLPALLTAFGRWIFWPLVPRNDRIVDADHGLWARVARLVGRGRRPLWIVISLGLVGLTLGLGSLNAGGLSNADQFVGKPDSVVGANAVARHFPAGSGTPTVVIGDAAAAGPLRAAISGTPGVAAVGEPVTAAGSVQFEATLSDSADGKAARRTVERLRAAVHALPGAHAKVGGVSATALDIDRASDRDNKVIIPVVLLVIMVILGMLLRALVAPLLMMATVVLSFGAALGVSGYVFHHVFGFNGTDPAFPLLTFIFLVALGVDYNIFLMHRVREESRVIGTRQGVLRGLTVTGGVITSAGLVLAATFAVLATLPMVSMAELGFTVAFGVLLDSIIVRSLLLPALAYDLGDRIWAPRRRTRPQVRGRREERVLERIG